MFYRSTFQRLLGFWGAMDGRTGPNLIMGIRNQWNQVFYESISGILKHLIIKGKNLPRDSNVRF